VAGFVNGEPVSAGEYRLVMARKTAGVFQFFKERDNLDDHAGYWSEDSGPDGPLAKLRETTLEELVRIKVCQGLAKEKGLIRETGFASFRQELAAENARRKGTMAAGQPVYGPPHYREAAYYYVRFGELSHRLRRALAQEAEPGITEDDIRAFYRENRKAMGEKSLEELRSGILPVLGERQAMQRLERCYAQAVVKMDQRLLREIVPRADPVLLPPDS
jgi:hypothetical protein